MEDKKPRRVGISFKKLFKDHMRVRIRQEPQLDNFDYYTVSTVIKVFNELLRDAVLEGYKFKAPGFGTISIKKQNRGSVPKINWTPSLKKKQEIIDRGGTPLKHYKDENGELKDNGGEEWRIVYTDPFFYMWSLWKRNHKVVNGKLWKFESHSENRKLLTARITEDEINTLVYD